MTKGSGAGIATTATLARETIGVGAVSALGMACLYLFHAYTARLLGATEYGAFSYALAVANVLAVLSLGGTHTAALRFGSIHWRADDPAQFKGLLLLCFGIVLTAGLLVVAGFHLLSPHFTALDRSTAATVQCGIWAIPALSLLQLRAKFVCAIGRPIDSNWPTALVVPGAAMALLAILASTRGASAATSMMCFVCASLVALLAGLVTMVRALPDRYRAVAPRFDLLRVLGVALPVLVASFWQILQPRVAHLALGAVGDPTGVGLYSAALRTALLIEFPRSVVNVVVGRYFAVAHQRADLAELDRIYRKSTNWVVVAALPSAVLLVLAAGPALGVFGSDFAAGRWVLVPLVLGQFSISFFGCVDGLLLTCGQQVRHTVILASTTTTTLAACAFVVPRFGAEGAALVTLVTTLGGRTAMAWVARRKLALAATPLPHIGLLGAVAVAALAYLAVAALWGDVAAVAAYLLVAAALMPRLGLPPEDRLVAKRYMRSLGTTLRSSIRGVPG